MKRILSGLVIIPILVLIIIYLPKYVLNVLITLIALRALYELSKAVNKLNYKSIKIIMYPLSFLLLIIGIIDLSFILPILSLLLLISVLIYGCILSKDKNVLENISITLFFIVYIVFLLSFILKVYYLNTSDLDIGRYIVWFIIIGAAGTDSCAHIIGTLFGKIKLCPSLSPKKTIEGAIGAVVGGPILFLIYTFILNTYFDFSINYITIILLGIIVAIFSQVGDLVASGIKRKMGIKDFGNLIPGHGGIMDRIDSIMFVAPIIYYAFRFIL